MQQKNSFAPMEFVFTRIYMRKCEVVDMAIEKRLGYALGRNTGPTKSALGCA